MALVKFFRGEGKFYTKEKYGPDALYFATDEKKIWLDGTAYGFNPDDLKNLDLVSTIDWVDPDTFTVVSTDGTQEIFKIPEATKLENGTYQSGLISALDKEKLDNSKETYVLNGLTNLQEGANQDSIIKAVGSFENLWEALNEGKDIIDLSFSTYKKPIYVTGNFSSGNGGINLTFLESNVLSIYQVQYVNNAYALAVISKTTFQSETDSRFNTTAKTVFGAINELQTLINNVKADLEEQVVGIYHFKGAVDTINDLPQEGMKAGDTYMVRQAFDFDENHYAEGTHVVWTGEKWVAMEGESGYSKKEADDKFVAWSDSTKRHIPLPIDGSITAVQETSTGSSGVLLCQRDYGTGNVTEVGNVRNKLTLNATERPQIDLAGGAQEKMAFESDLLKYGMYYPGVKVDTQKLFALTKASTEDDIKAALQLETASGSYTLPTEKILNDCLGKGYQLLSNWMPVSVAWNGAAWVFYIVGQTYMNQPNSVATVSIKITDGTYSVFQAAKVTELVDTDDIKLIPNVIRFPLRTLQDKVYTQEEILEWFGATEVPELKQKIVRGGIYYLQYGISLSGNPMYYKMPVDYVAFESANQIKLVFNGLDTHNDHPAKYEILINLDGTIIEGNSNIKVTQTNIITADDLESEINKASKTFVISLDNTDEAKTNNKEIFTAFKDVTEEATPVNNVFVKNKRVIGLMGATRLVPLTGVKLTGGQLHFYTDIPVQLQTTDYPDSINFGNVDITIAEDGTTNVQTSNTLINSGGNILNYSQGGLVAKVTLGLENSSLKLKGVDDVVISSIDLSSDVINGVGEGQTITNNIEDIQDALSWTDVTE